MKKLNWNRNKITFIVRKILLRCPLRSGTYLSPLRAVPEGDTKEPFDRQTKRRKKGVRKLLATLSTTENSVYLAALHAVKNVREQGWDGS